MGSPSSLPCSWRLEGHVALPRPVSLTPTFHLALVSGVCRDRLPKLSGFIHHAWQALRSQRPEVQMQGVDGAVLPQEALGRILPVPSSCWWLPLGLWPRHSNLGRMAFSPLGLPVTEGPLSLD